MSMILKAEVKTATGKTKHAIGTVRDGTPIPVQILPLPLYVCIAREEEGFYLLQFNAADESFADTWHDSLAGAKQQAHFEFEIVESDWKQL